MDMLRKLSAILQRRDAECSDQELIIASDSSRIPEGISKEFDTFGLRWLHTIAPCFALDGNKVLIIYRFIEVEMFVW